MQPLIKKVWNFDEVVFDPNDKWAIVVFKYPKKTHQKLQSQMGGKALFWYTKLFFTSKYGQFLFQLSMMNKVRGFIYDIMYRIPCY